LHTGIGSLGKACPDSWDTTTILAYPGMGISKVAYLEKYPRIPGIL